MLFNINLAVLVLEPAAEYHSYIQARKKEKTGRPEDIERKDAFFKVIYFLEDGDEEQITNHYLSSE